MMMQDDNPFGALPQFGGGGYPGGPMTMAGPSGFSGMGGLGGGMFGQDPQKRKKKNGLNPLMFLSPFLGGMMQDPKTTMSLMSPAFGLANLLGAFK